MSVTINTSLVSSVERCVMVDRAIGCGGTRSIDSAATVQRNGRVADVKRTVTSVCQRMDCYDCCWIAVELLRVARLLARTRLCRCHGLASADELC